MSVQFLFETLLPDLFKTSGQSQSRASVQFLGGDKDFRSIVDNSTTGEGQSHDLGKSDDPAGARHRTESNQQAETHDSALSESVPEEIPTNIVREEVERHLPNSESFNDPQYQPNLTSDEKLSEEEAVLFDPWDPARTAAAPLPPKPEKSKETGFFTPSPTAASSAGPHRAVSPDLSTSPAPSGTAGVEAAKTANQNHTRSDAVVEPSIVPLEAKSTGTDAKDRPNADSQLLGISPPRSGFIYSYREDTPVPKPEKDRSPQPNSPQQFAAKSEITSSSSIGSPRTEETLSFPREQASASIKEHQITPKPHPSYLHKAEALSSSFFNMNSVQSETLKSKENWNVRLGQKSDTAASLLPEMSKQPQTLQRTEIDKTPMKTSSHKTESGSKAPYGASGATQQSETRTAITKEVAPPEKDASVHSFHGRSIFGKSLTPVILQGNRADSRIINPTQETPQIASQPEAVPPPSIKTSEKEGSVSKTASHSLGPEDKLKGHLHQNPVSVTWRPMTGSVEVRVSEKAPSQEGPENSVRLVVAELEKGAIAKAPPSNPSSLTEPFTPASAIKSSLPITAPRVVPVSLHESTAPNYHRSGAPENSKPKFTQATNHMTVQAQKHAQGYHLTAEASQPEVMVNSTKKLQEPNRPQQNDLRNLDSFGRMPTKFFMASRHEKAKESPTSDRFTQPLVRTNDVLKRSGIHTGSQSYQGRTKNMLPPLESPDQPHREIGARKTSFRADQAPKEKIEISQREAVAVQALPKNFTQSAQKKERSVETPGKILDAKRSSHAGSPGTMQVSSRMTLENPARPSTHAFTESRSMGKTQEIRAQLAEPNSNRIQTRPLLPTTRAPNAAAGNFEVSPSEELAPLSRPRGHSLTAADLSNSSQDQPTSLNVNRSPEGTRTEPNVGDIEKSDTIKIPAFSNPTSTIRSETQGVSAKPSSEMRESAAVQGLHETNTPNSGADITSRTGAKVRAVNPAIKESDRTVGDAEQHKLIRKRINMDGVPAYGRTLLPEDTPFTATIDPPPMPTPREGKSSKSGIDRTSGKAFETASVFRSQSNTGTKLPGGETRSLTELQSQETVALKLDHDIGDTLTQRGRAIEQAHSTAATQSNSSPASPIKQVSEALQRPLDGTVEVELRPAELGRVRLIFTPQDGVLTVSLSADRPETLDFMRRNIDQLAQELRQLGYERASFDFGSGGRGSGADKSTLGTNASATAGTGSPETEAEVPSSHREKSTRLNGLDLRI